MDIHAILTGDLIKSRRVDSTAVAAAFDVLQASANDYGKALGIDLRFTRYRGDGWQVVLTDPGLTLDATLYLLARLRAAQPKMATRIAVGIGTTQTLGTKDLSDGTGPAFFTSGDHIDKMSPRRQLVLAGQGVGPSQAALIDLTEFITASWTAAQAEAVACALLNAPRTHEDIAKELGITRQAVQSRLAGAGFSYFETAISAIRSHDFATPQAD